MQEKEKGGGVGVGVGVGVGEGVGAIALITSLNGLKSPLVTKNNTTMLSASNTSATANLGMLLTRYFLPLNLNCCLLSLIPFPCSKSGFKSVYPLKQATFRVREPASSYGNFCPPQARRA